MGYDLESHLCIPISLRTLTSLIYLHRYPQDLKFLRRIFHRPLNRQIPGSPPYAYLTKLHLWPHLLLHSWLHHPFDLQPCSTFKKSSTFTIQDWVQQPLQHPSLSATLLINHLQPSSHSILISIAFFFSSFLLSFFCLPFPPVKGGANSSARAEDNCIPVQRMRKSGG